MLTVEIRESRRRRTDPLIPPALDGMKALVEALNPRRVVRKVAGQVSFRDLPISADEDKVALRQLVDQWMKSGPNLRKMFSDDPQLAAATRYGKAILYPGIEGRGYLDWTPETPEAYLSTEKYDFSSPRDKALKLFAELIINPGWSLLAGPCRRCDNYFLCESKHKRVYCSRTCSSHATAISAIVKKRKRDREDKLKRARRLIEDWKTAKTTRVTWKQWLLRDPTFTKNWITRAVTRGLLEEPTA